MRAFVDYDIFLTIDFNDFNYESTLFIKKKKFKKSYLYIMKNKVFVIIQGIMRLVFV